MTQIYFTSDTHWSHSNIVGPSISEWKSGYRDFNSLQEMNDAIVNSINAVVKPDDILYHLGDWSFGGHDKIPIFRNQLYVKRIRLVLGNHDHHIKRKPEYQSLFEWVKDYYECGIQKQFIVMSHFAFRVWHNSHKGSWNLYGHSHGNLLPLGKGLDVGWDIWRRPLSFEEIKAILDTRPMNLEDHHGDETN